MTRKRALREAIQIVSNARIGRQRKAGILAALALCQRELPFAHWSREAIFDACDAWVEEHGALTLRAFASPEMPSHGAVKNRFGMTAREFRDRYYPLEGGPAGSPYAGECAAVWNERFRADFHAMGCTGQADYNERRDRSLPTWNTVAAMNGVRSWSALLAALELRPYEKPKDRPRAAVRICGETPAENAAHR